MALINTADRIRLGTAGAKRVYAGVTKVWEFAASLNPAVGTVSTPDVVQDPAGGVRYTANPTGAVTYTRVVGTSRIVGANPAGAIYPGTIRLLDLTAINRAQLVFPGVVGNYASVPDSASLDLTGDIEIVARLAPVDWTVTGALQTIVAKDQSAAGSRSWYLSITADGRLRFSQSADGTSAPTSVSTGVLAVTDGVMVWVKVTRVAATGLVSFYTAADSPTEPTTWTSVGTATSATGPLYAGTANLMIAARGTGSTEPFMGRIARAIVRNGIAGTTVLDVSENNAGAMATGTTFVATSGQTVTVNQTAGNTIVQPQVDALVWRFDAAEYTSGTSYTDPRGRTWTVPAGAIGVP